MHVATRTELCIWARACLTSKQAHERKARLPAVTKSAPRCAHTLSHIQGLVRAHFECTHIQNSWKTYARTF
eukprot:4869991-Pleurochrysis_carterae.AAC.1